MTHRFPLDGKESVTRAIQAAVAAAGAAAPTPPAKPLTQVGDPAWRRRYRRAFRELTRLAGPDGNPAMARAGLDVLTSAAMTQASSTPSSPNGVNAMPDERADSGRSQPVSPVPTHTRGIDPRLLTEEGQQALEAVTRDPSSWSCPARTIVILGAGAELAPTIPLLLAGAHVHAVMRSTSTRRAHLHKVAASAAGTLTFAPDHLGDVLADPSALADHLADLPGEIALVNALYSPGRTHVHLALAAHLVASRVLAKRPGTPVMLLGTPTDSYWVDGSLLDASLAPQGPNYLAAKRIERWSAEVLADDGARVIAPVLPPTRTASVLVSNRIETALRGAQMFGIHAAEPAFAAGLAASWLIAGLNTSSLRPWTGWAAPYGMWSRLPSATIRLTLGYLAGTLGLRGNRNRSSAPKGSPAS
ncbi:hypothetical protein BSZ39_03285 [Bowdeniella nasicola]|uniref:Uncharacterized protein n=1 Tax=Bowdeniella nasicola TaxID=208480 RepID=A0A1Q5Q439_9ACTO|nr:hypothetical protein [Bowdeniella nasicola]OKL54565.1 hypothetical protein BSZ39_03285 [Bowdeniella nasicola]